jgi:hypothetical protein
MTDLSVSRAPHTQHLDHIQRTIRLRGEPLLDPGGGVDLNLNGRARKGGRGGRAADG